MRKIAIYFILIFISLPSCIKHVLDSAPLDVISDNNVWGDTVLMDGYLAHIYAHMGTTVLLLGTTYTIYQSQTRSDDWYGPFILNDVGNEGFRSWLHGASDKKILGLKINGGLLEWWENSYIDIRALNEFIERVPLTDVSEDYKKERVAEARFLRAFNYFEMVKRYGGVPLITRTQHSDEPKDSLYPKRAKEQAIYDFVISELESISNDLPDKNGTNYGAATKGAALALASRAALYAGSIAQFGTVQLDGGVGIDPSKKDYYYTKAYTAAQVLMNSNKYALYDQDADKVENFKNIFLKKNNSEVIFAIIHDDKMQTKGGNAWAWDFFQCPKPHGWNAGNQNAPYLEMAESYEHVDGLTGKLNYDNLETGLWNIEDLWANKDPRFYATIWTEKTPWQGSYVDGHNGIILPDGTVQTSGSYDGILAKGPQTNHYLTGFGVMKYLDESHDNTGERSTSSTDFLVLRYGEVLLNYAEAAFELGKTGDALNAINQIRKRAGIVPLTTINRDTIHHERKVELAFEGHNYWDLRRWRTAVEALSKNGHGLRYILDYTTRKYRLEVLERVEGLDMEGKFKPMNYYLPITLTRTANNPNLVENPGYE